jgi:hypothetical protein
MPKATSQNITKRARISPKPPVDPIFAAIEQTQKLEKLWGDLNSKLDVAQSKAEKKHGRRPLALIAWRKYGAIGGLAGERAEKAWDRRAGMAVHRREYDLALNAERDATIRMSKTRPTTPAGAAAMLKYVLSDALVGEMEWHSVAFDTIIATISTWTLQAK